MVTCPIGIAGIWTGAYDKDWFNCRNWADGNVPTITVSVLIPNTSNTCEIDAANSSYAAAFGNVASCKNLTVNNNTLSFSLMDTLIDAGDVTIKNDGTINMTTGGKLELQGDWKDQVSTAGKGFKDGFGSVIFSGSATQSISTVNATELFYNLQINKSYTTGLVNLNNNITVEHNLTLTQGIFTTGYNLFTWKNNGGTLSAPEPSYTANSTNYTKSFIATCDSTGKPINVAGPTTPFGGNAGFQIKNVGNTDTYFPVGASFLPAMTDQVPAPNRMMINSESGTPQDFTVAVNYGDIGYTNGGGGSRRVNRIWYVKSNPDTGKATMQLFFTKRDMTSWGSDENEVEAGFSYGQPALVQKDYSGGRGNFINLSDPPDITSFLGNNYNTEIYAQYTIGLSTSLTNGIRQFNRFSIVNTASIILPVNIVNFKAYLKGNGIQLNWTALNEINIDRYEAEKSINGTSFASIGHVNAFNNSNSVNYSKTDISPAPGNNFYRIKAIDKNGTVTYTAIALVNIGNGKSSVSIYPNPVQNRIVNVQFINLPAGNYNLVLYNTLGQPISARKIEHTGGSATQNFMLPVNAAKGAYIVKLFNKTFDFTSRIVVE